MVSKKNTELLKEVKEKMDKANAVFFVDYQGMPHKMLEEARVAFDEVGSELSIVKNTLMRIALREKKIDVDDLLQGPRAVLFTYEDPLKAVKTLYSFFKKNNLPKVEFGVFEGRVVDKTVIDELSTIPSRDVLLGKIVGLLKSPMTNLVYSLNYNITKLALILKEVERKKASS
ncbi:50S ribosomal protein L10 [Candidatus Parcubacteria bacterium]|nr:MAG: 50S ribosomal protein L10 [Candidatus Parcubacteria bacterium]